MLACPFWKKDPDNHRHCYKKVLSKIKYVKSHLYRFHKAPITCPCCGIEFQNEGARDEHLRARRCNLVESGYMANHEGLSQARMRQVSRRANPKQSEEEQWFAIWNTIFPDDPPPSSAYIDNVLSEDLYSSREFLASAGTDNILDYLPNSGIFDCDINLVTSEDSLGISSMSSIQTSIGSHSDFDGLQDGRDRKISIEQQREIKREPFEQMKRILGITTGGVDSDEEYTPPDQKLGPTVMRKMSQDPGPPTPRAEILGSQAPVSSKPPTPFDVSSHIDPFVQSRPPSTPGDYSISSADPGSRLAFFQHPSAVARYHMPLISGPIMSNLMAPGHQIPFVPGIAISGGYGAHHLAPSMYNSSHAGQTNQQPDRPFKCDQCPQSFNRNHDLKRHKRIHLAVKPFPCNHCDKSFSRKDALKRHRLVKGCGSKEGDGQKDNSLRSSDEEEELLNSSQGLDHPRPSCSKEELRNDFQGLSNLDEVMIEQQ